MGKEKDGSAELSGPELDDMIGRGREKGFLTYSEIDNLLPGTAEDNEDIDRISVRSRIRGWTSSMRANWEAALMIKQSRKRGKAAPSRMRTETGVPPACRGKPGTICSGLTWNR